MNRLRPWVLPILVLPLVSCITTRPRSAQPAPAAEVIRTVPVRQWGDNTCGSGALSAVLNHFGDPVSEAELDQAFPKGRHGGVVSVDLLLETRRRGFDARIVQGDRALVVERVRAGVPVILMLRVVDLPGARGDLFHYVIADGYDPERELFRVQFGDGKARWTRLERLARAWEGAGNATLLVEPQALESALRQAVLLEEKGRLDEARESYLHLAVRHSDSAIVWTNLGNVEARRGDPDAAESAYRRAIEIDPEGRDALNNLAWLLYGERRLDEAETIARRAVEAPGPDPHLAWDTLGHVLVARGECREAAEAWTRALESPSLDRAGRAAATAALQSTLRDCDDAPRPAAATEAAPSTVARGRRLRVD
ncbi:MAG TPA: tetratricopeptide repeat protein [Thermoanaerobaculia bacterium]|nr:tetratricopeptide repeat protein [Thermoanaerobaculia bacterium]